MRALDLFIHVLTERLGRGLIHIHLLHLRIQVALKTQGVHRQIIKDTADGGAVRFGGGSRILPDRPFQIGQNHIQQIVVLHKRVAVLCVQLGYLLKVWKMTYWSLLGLRRRVFLMLLQQLNQHAHMMGMGLNLLLTQLADRLVLRNAGGGRILLDQHLFIGDGIRDIRQFFAG
ncbi:hypothetical protein D3C73_1270040 [compost metagenome]